MVRPLDAPVQVATTESREVVREARRVRRFEEAGTQLVGHANRGPDDVVSQPVHASAAGFVEDVSATGPAAVRAS